MTRNRNSYRIGGWAGLFFSFGLFAVGFSSAITAPLAAAITARGLFDSGEGGRWSARSWRYRGMWMCVLIASVVLGLLEVKPIPAIILAQALNGILLPFVAVFLLIIVNDRVIMGQDGLNHLLSNICMGLVVAVPIVLGVTNVAKALSAAFDMPALGERELLLAVPVVRAAENRRGDRVLIVVADGRYHRASTIFFEISIFPALSR